MAPACVCAVAVSRRAHAPSPEIDVPETQTEHVDASRHERHASGHSWHSPQSGKNDSEHFSVLFDKTRSAVESFSTHVPSTRTELSLHRRHNSLVHLSHLSWHLTHEVNSGLFPMRHSTQTAPSPIQLVGGMQVPSIMTALWQTSAVGPARSAAARQSGRDNQAMLPTARRLFRRGQRHPQKKAGCPVQRQGCDHHNPMRVGG